MHNCLHASYRKTTYVTQNKQCRWNQLRIEIQIFSVKPEGLLGDIKTANVFHHPVKAKI